MSASRSERRCCDGRTSTPGAANLVRLPVYLVATRGGRTMSAHQKSESPAATGQFAEQTKHPRNVPPAQFFSKLRAEVRGDCRVPLGYRLFPGEFLSKRATAQWIDLIRRAARADVQIDLVYGEFRRRPNYLIQRNREVLACLPDAEAAGRYLAGLGGCDGI